MSTTGRRIPRAEALAIVEAARAEMRKQLEPGVAALEKAARERAQLAALHKQVLQLAARLEEIEKREGVGPGSNGHTNGRWDGVL